VSDNEVIGILITAFFVTLIVAIVSGVLYSTQITKQFTVREKACVSSGQQWNHGNCVKTVQP
jgi:hypothetical protein